MVEGGTLVAAVGAAAARVDALHVLQLVLPAERPVGLPGQVVLGLRPAALVLAHAVPHVDHALLAVRPAARGRRHAGEVEARQLGAPCVHAAGHNMVVAPMAHA